MRVIHTAAELNNQASGPSHSIPHLLCELQQLGVDVSLQALQPAPERQLDFPQVYHPKWRLLQPLGISPVMRRTLHQMAAEADIIHTHNLWMMPNVYPYAASKRNGCRLVLTPRGTLTKWAFQYRWRKKWAFWTMMQKQVVYEADLIHATSEDELRDLRDLGVRVPVALISNGVEVPPLEEQSYEVLPRKLLYLGRIHPKKGIEKLLVAWCTLQMKHPDWELEIVGPDNIGHLEEMKRKATELGLQRIQFRPPVFGVDKDKTYQRAKLFALPTYSENFGIAVAEALANGVPAVVTKGAPWEGLNTEGCGWWIEDDPSVITATLDEAMSLTDEERRARGLRGRRWIEREFSWHHVASAMKETYEWLLGQREQPDWVATA